MAYIYYSVEDLIIFESYTHTHTHVQVHAIKLMHVNYYDCVTVHMQYCFILNASNLPRIYRLDFDDVGKTYSSCYTFPIL